MYSCETPTEKRFWRKVNIRTDNGCWLWMGGVDSYGYGEFYYEGEKRLAHRVSYILNVGPVAPKLLVCHRCDVPSCVNPAHMFLGSVADNNADKIRKGRHLPGVRRGESNKLAKLTEQNVLAIRASAESDTVLARKYGVARGIIWKARHGRSWAHVQDPAGGRAERAALAAADFGNPERGRGRAG